jgi:hypothetical protein
MKMPSILKKGLNITKRILAGDVIVPRTNIVFNNLPDQPTDSQLMRMRCDSQSLHYYSDISASMSRHIPGHNTFSLLDVGPRTGAGLAFLRLVHHPLAYTRLKLDPVAGIDLDPMFAQVAGLEFPDIKPMVGDIYDLEPKSWDIVTCSHTIEHIPEAEEFVKQLENLARKYVILACPFAESPLSDDHVRSIDYKFFTSLGFYDVQIYESQHWHNGVVCMAFKAL